MYSGINSKSVYWCCVYLDVIVPDIIVLRLLTTPLVVPSILSGSILRILHWNRLKISTYRGKES